MSTTEILGATEFQSRLERYLYERSEEWRAVRVGEKEVSEQAEIVRRYADLFSREQLDALQASEGDVAGDDRELLYRLRKTCESGLISSQLAEREDEVRPRDVAVVAVERAHGQPAMTHPGFRPVVKVLLLVAAENESTRQPGRNVLTAAQGHEQPALASRIAGAGPQAFERTA